MAKFAKTVIAYKMKTVHDKDFLKVLSLIHPFIDCTYFHLYKQKSVNKGYRVKISIKYSIPNV